MILQIEVTTRCNFGCVYCAGREMMQEDMPLATFKSTVNDFIERNGKPDWVMLQGEGESTMHADFENMLGILEYKGINVHLTTNGTYPYPERLKTLKKLVVSIDSIDHEKSVSIGRMNTAKAMKFVEDCVAAGINTEVVSVSHVLESIEIQGVRDWVKSVGASYRIQQLMTKPDYSDFYPITFFPLKQKPEKLGATLKCSYISGPVMEYYTVRNEKLPCCFIKNTDKFVSKEHMQQQIQKRIVPTVCTGCNYLISN